MKEGLYKMSFETDLGAGCGVAYFKDGKLCGGDSGFTMLEPTRNLMDVLR